MLRKSDGGCWKASDSVEQVSCELAAYRQNPQSSSTQGHAASGEGAVLWGQQCIGSVQPHRRLPLPSNILCVILSGLIWVLFPWLPCVNPSCRRGGEILAGPGHCRSLTPASWGLEKAMRGLGGRDGHGRWRRAWLSMRAWWRTTVKRKSDLRSGSAKCRNWSTTA